MKFSFFITNFSIVSTIFITVISSNTNANTLRTTWYRIEANKTPTGYMAKTLSFDKDKFKIKSTIYNYEGQDFRIHEITSFADKTLKPLSYEHVIKRTKDSKDNIVIKAEFNNNILSKTKTLDNQTFFRQDVIPQNTILKDFLYLVSINDEISNNQIKTYNVLDNSFYKMEPKIDPVVLEEKKIYKSQNIVLLKTSFGYTQIDKLGKIIFESNFNRNISLARDMRALRNYLMRL